MKLNDNIFWKMIQNQKNKDPNKPDNIELKPRPSLTRPMKKLNSTFLERIEKKEQNASNPTSQLLYRKRGSLKSLEQQELEKIEKLSTFNKIIKLQNFCKEMISTKERFSKNKTEMICKINNLKEASYSLINKQKNEFERRDKNKNNKITPETYCIISQKKYNDLTWYLISNIFPNEKIIPKKYDNFRWVTGESIDPNLFQKFYNDEVKLNDIYSYIKKIQDKLDQKEEENKKNYKLKNNSESIKNETSSYFDISLNKSNSYKNINKNKINPYIDENKEFEKK